MNLFKDTTPKPLKQLLGGIDACEAALPDFHRDFVWERERHEARGAPAQASAFVARQSKRPGSEQGNRGESVA